MKLSRGFTIIELIISIFVLSVGIVGVFSAFSIMVILTSDAADRLTATYLAQEGMEIVRNIRDNNWLNPGSTWLDNGLNGCGAASGGCKADYADASLVPNADGDYLYLNDKGFYVYNPPLNPQPKPTRFERRIIITCLPSGNCANDYVIKVTTQASWNQKANILYGGLSADSCGQHNCVTTEETLYNWY